MNYKFKIDRKETRYSLSITLLCSGPAILHLLLFPTKISATDRHSVPVYPLTTKDFRLRRKIVHSFGHDNSARRREKFWREELFSFCLLEVSPFHRRWAQPDIAGWRRIATCSNPRSPLSFSRSTQFTSRRKIEREGMISTKLRPRNDGATVKTAEVHRHAQLVFLSLGFPSLTKKSPPSKLQQ